MSSDESNSKDAPLSALHSNIRDKGTNAYYYAHKKRSGADDHQWDGQCEPRLIAKSDSVISVSTDRPITSYAWSDGKKCATVYIDIPAIASHPDESITLDWSARELEVRIRDFDPSGADLVFKIKYLYEEVMGVTLKKKDDKIVLRLVKAKELTWYTLKKDHP
ncbi:hypothetical protein H310_10977 [Aphanomyces invadans]|uniref:CS domain-containing protein n=1 Tax=Aphanomyces invadans TaxID=157072 RepID=A0A024TNE3_9STRA|nr:hypothetical protein H310_10977 [Aphanomyces invadans]ETV95514.1 hypothetical protein H310_10977 [Aphanomyces invadans]RHY30608.1 hypothetical protein DYB32_004193 [Aphanomyces invadans]|eukprot:XP_008875707.1 hypothetical protein H310_10977 [Aphanomyces invadans]